MKTWAKIAIGCLVVLVLCCLILAGTFIFAGAWLKSKLGGFFGGAYDMGKNISAIQQMDQQYPFQEPADGLLREDRLQAFMSICKKINGVSAPLQADLERLNSGGEGNMEDANKAMAAVATITQALKEGLEQNQMSPSEFRWIEMTAYSALDEAPAEGGSDIQGMEGFEAMTKASLEVLEPQLNDPGLTPEQRAALESQIAELRAQLGQGAAPASGPSPNAAVVDRYRQELQENDVRHLVAMGMSGN